jgi:hypothetical protein
MKPGSYLKILCIVMMVVSLAGCNYPGMAPAATPTSLPPTPTSPPPTEPPTPVPPTDTPAPPPPTATTAPPTPVPATPTSRPTATTAVIKPEAGAKFEGTFEGGTLVFRINAISSAVIPKTINVRKATCQEGKLLSTTLAFDPPPSYDIENGKFTISRDTQLYLTGIFTKSDEARGTLEIKYKKEGVTCTIGPVVWVATAVP